MAQKKRKRRGLFAGRYFVKHFLGSSSGVKFAMLTNTPCSITAIRKAAYFRQSAPAWQNRLFLNSRPCWKNFH